MNQSFINLIWPVGIILLFSYANFILLQKKRLGVFINFLTSLTISPLIISLLLYTIILIHPSQSNAYYTSLINVLITIYSLSVVVIIKPKYNYVFPKISLNKQSKIFLWIVVSIFLLVGVRAVFWPIYWDDQIKYVKQAYSMGKVKDVGFYLQCKTYSDSNVKHQMDPAIRPGLYMLYTYFYLNNPIYDNLPITAQVIVIYYYLLLLFTTFYLGSIRSSDNKPNYNKGVLSALLISTCYYFINFTIYGFKEVIICLLMLLSFTTVFEIRRKEKIVSDCFILGILLGLMSYINYSGTIISGIIALCVFLFVRKPFLERIKIIAIIVFSTLIFSGNEILVFLYTYAGGVFSIRPSVVPNLSELASNSRIAGELQGYRIHNILDIYVKGKLQGLFQVQFYGFIIPVFIVTLLFRYKNLVNNYKHKILLFFLLVFSFIFFDPLSLNNDQAAYVLIVSPKYTLILIPIVSVLIASQLGWFVKIFRKLLPHHIILLLILTLPIWIYILYNQQIIYNLINTNTPLYRSENYYYSLIDIFFKILIIASSTMLSVLILEYLNNKSKLNRFWCNYSLSFMLFITCIFIFPFLFIFDSNYGIRDILSKSFLKTEEKLLLMKSVAETNRLIFAINDKYHKESIFMLSGFSSNTIFYIEKDPKLIFYRPANKHLCLEDFLVENNIELIFAKKDANFGEQKLMTKKYLSLIEETSEINLYKVNHKIISD